MAIDALPRGFHQALSNNIGDGDLNCPIIRNARCPIERREAANIPLNVLTSRSNDILPTAPQVISCYSRTYFLPFFPLQPVNFLLTPHSPPHASTPVHYHQI